MKILVTNDDGIYSTGLWTLAAELQKLAEVVVVAPDREQSAMSASFSLHQPLHYTEVKSQVPGIKAFSVDGTPSDSVILALGILEGVGMVFSGINAGSNLGTDVLLSGTVGAALQGYFHGLPSIAISIAVGEEMHYSTAAWFAGKLASKIISNPPPKGKLLNVNIPNLPIEEIKGIEITRVTNGSYNDVIEKGNDGKRDYYWIIRQQPGWNIIEGTDICALESDKVSITSLQGEMCVIHEDPFVKNLHTLLHQDLL